MSAATTDERDLPAADDTAQVTGQRWPRWLRGAVPYSIAAALFVAAVTVYRLGAIRDARYPGHADPAFYYNVAQNIHAGRGPQINYIWEFLSGQPSLPRYAFDYWLPLTSVLMSVALRFGDGLATALTANVVASAVLAVSSYALARCITRSAWVPAAAAAIVAVQPSVSVFSVVAEGPIYLATFAVLAMLASIGARSRPWLWPIAGILAAGGNLARSEGLLLAVAVIVTAIAWSARGRRILHAGAALAGYLVAMSPLYVLNFQHMGTLLPAASSKFPFVTKFEDLYSLHVTRTPSAFFGNSVTDFLVSRLTVFGDEVVSGIESMYSIDVAVLAVLLGAGLAHQASRSWTRTISSPWFMPAGFAVFAMLFFAVIIPVLSGETGKWMIVIMPMFVIAGLVQLPELGLRPVTTLVIVAALAGAPLLTLATVTRSIIASNNRVGDRVAVLKPLLDAEQACLSKPLVLMTRSPWETTQATGYRTVMIPNGTLDDTLAVARRYGVTDIQIDFTRPALLPEPLRSADGPFGVSKVPRIQRIYRVRPDIGSTRC